MLYFANLDEIELIQNFAKIQSVGAHLQLILIDLSQLDLTKSKSLKIIQKNSQIFREFLRIQFVISPEQISTLGEFNHNFKIINELICRINPASLVDQYQPQWHGIHGEDPVFKATSKMWNENVNRAGDYGMLLSPAIDISEINFWLTPVLDFFQTQKCNRIFLETKKSPTPSAIEILRGSFADLTMRNYKFKQIYFLPNSVELEAWEDLSRNIFAGPSEVHIDVCNTCTHSCEFCGLYSTHALKQNQRADGKGLRSEVSALMKEKISKSHFDSLMNDLPDKVTKIQFGGKGDPLLHPNIYEFVKQVCLRGIDVEILTNLEYPNDERIQELIQLAGNKPNRIQLIVNLSAGTPETYIKTRPRQTRETWDKVIYNLNLISQFKNRGVGKGLAVVLMCVTYKENFRDALRYVDLCKQTGANAIWFKPLEIHDDYQKKLVVSETELEEYSKTLQEAVRYASQLGVLVFQKNVIESLSSSLENQDANRVSVGVVDAGLRRDFYLENSCQIGNHYARFEVDGAIKGCCSSRHALGHLSQKSFHEIWFSNQFDSFRRKMSKIQSEKFHMKDPEWAFCQQCPHQHVNERIARNEAQWK